MTSCALWDPSILKKIFSVYEKSVYCMYMLWYNAIIAAASKNQQHALAKTAQLISAFVFTSWIVQFLFYIYFQIFKLLALFHDSTGRFVSDLVKNPNCLFSQVKAQLLYLPFYFYFFDSV